MTTTPVRGTWEDSALCAQIDPELFFPNQGETSRLALEICAMCDVRLQCLDYALSTRQRDGIWGGLTPDDRLVLERAGARRELA